MSAADDLAVILCRTQAEMVGNTAPEAPCDYHQRHAATILAAGYVPAERLALVRDSCRDVTADLRARLAEVTAERGELAVRLGRAERLVDQWLAGTQDGLGQRREHWRGADFVEGEDFGREECAGDLRDAIAPTTDGGPR